MHNRPYCITKTVLVAKIRIFNAFFHNLDVFFKKMLFELYFSEVNGL